MDAQKQENSTGMPVKIGIIAALLVTVVLAVVLKNQKKEELIMLNKPVQQSEEPADEVTAAEGAEVSGTVAENTEKVLSEPETSLPKLLDLGAGTCIPCRMMEPILEELTKEFAGKMDVQFIDVRMNPTAGRKYGISLIPTQIFFDASGKELYRHEGFFPREEILKKWAELGIEFTGGQENQEKEAEGVQQEPEPSRGGG